MRNGKLGLLCEVGEYIDIEGFGGTRERTSTLERGSDGGFACRENLGLGRHTVVCLVLHIGAVGGVAVGLNGDHRGIGAGELDVADGVCLHIEREPILVGFGDIAVIVHLVAEALDLDVVANVAL